jgi:predicted nucleic acid-binding protein
LAKYFFDTSALVKYYHAESGTVEVSVIVAEPGSQIRISTLGLLETQAAFAMKVRSGFLNRQSAGAFRARLMLDVASDVVQPYTVTDDHFDSAERLIGRYAFSMRLRSLDALQLAVALDLKEQGLVDQFVAADKALLEVAALAGFSVVNPEALEQSQMSRKTPS